MAEDAKDLPHAPSRREIEEFFTEPEATVAEAATQVGMTEANGRIAQRLGDHVENIASKRAPEPDDLDIHIGKAGHDA